MASVNQCLASMARLSLASSVRPTASRISPFLVPSVVQTRCASKKSKSGGKSSGRSNPVISRTEKKKKKAPKDYKAYNVKGCPQFSLCDAVRYVPPPARLRDRAV